MSKKDREALARVSRSSGARSRFAGTWKSRDKQQWLVFEWEESRVSNAVALARKGFGTELIAQRVPYELRGKGALQRGKDGMTAQIEFPLLRSNSILETSMSERSL